MSSQRNAEEEENTSDDSEEEDDDDDDQHRIVFFFLQIGFVSFVPTQWNKEALWAHQIKAGLLFLASEMLVPETGNSWCEMVAIIIIFHKTMPRK